MAKTLTKSAKKSTKKATKAAAATQETSEQLRIRLRKMGQKAGQNLHEMLGIAHAILSDRDYVTHHGGTARVRDELQAESFSHFGGGPAHLKRLLELYEKAPKEIWEKYDYFWEAVAAHVEGPNAKPKRGPRHDYKAERDELALEVKILKRQLADTQEQLRQAQQRVGELSCRLAPAHA